MQKYNVTKNKITKIIKINLLLLLHLNIKTHMIQLKKCRSKV